jgi:hypothetical protein
MLILVVDDLRYFGETYKDCIIHYALNSKDALCFLNDKTNFDMLSEIWLDHDLGLVDGIEDDIEPVINWLEEKAHAGDCSHISDIRILTNNPVGFQKISWLNKYFYIAPTPQPIAIRHVKFIE